MIRNNKSVIRESGQDEKNKSEQRVSDEKFDIKGKVDMIGESTEKELELNNNSICMLDQSEAPLPSKDCNLGDLDSMIQNQFDILSLAVKNILAVSSEDIYAKHKTYGKIGQTVKWKCFSTDNIFQKESSLVSIEEDLEFKEALCKFSEESLSMSAENIVTNSLKNISAASRKKSTHKSLNIFPMISEGRP